MEELTLDARTREAGHPNRSRREGYVPAVIYGRGREPRSVDVEAHALAAALARAGRHHVIHVGGQPTLVQEVQRDPVTDRVLHVDFHAVSLGEKVHAEVPLRVRGEELVHKATGGILQHQLLELRVNCRPSDLPDFLPVDVSGLAVGSVLTVADLVLPSGVEVLHEPEEVVLSVLAPRVEVGAASAASEAEKAAGEAGE